ncbi:hypothetical protein BCR33DRAFT_719499 [Rhizoclosmatium globosum]|uniref:Uncharacterized protein n=1 Tax=Rhizoclosmatium globosum TaxID=329046 RepID=A0A1Y2C0X6_9FUNG|nr:hypothetical protein BCR33DRAFT_719499 [Rhizoclosmatium globosum]|eukprot:ORY40554.1 hypothetical protein BCR33DRAFT_719499 [Rhizoclosmatium globosum]
MKVSALLLMTGTCHATGLIYGACMTTCLTGLGLTDTVAVAVLSTVTMGAGGAVASVTTPARYASYIATCAATCAPTIPASLIL